jgi:hypothetical protein
MDRSRGKIDGLYTGLRCKYSKLINGHVQLADRERLRDRHDVLRTFIVEAALLAIW